MAQKYVARIQLRKDTEANWGAVNPLLLDGELALVATTNDRIRIKVGDGTHRYAVLPFADEELVTGLAVHSSDEVVHITQVEREKWDDAAGLTPMSNWDIQNLLT